MENDTEIVEKLTTITPRKGIVGKVVIVTGASSGIGEATAREFAGAGAKVVLAARRTHLLEERPRRSALPAVPPCPSQPT